MEFYAVMTVRIAISSRPSTGEKKKTRKRVVKCRKELNSKINVVLWSLFAQIH